MAASVGVTGLRQFFRDNPQALVLLVITIVLGLGTFVAVVIAIAASGSDKTTGEPNDAITYLNAVIPLIRL